MKCKKLKRAFRTPCKRPSRVNVHILLKANIIRKRKLVLATKFRELGSGSDWGGGFTTIFIPGM